MAEKCYFLVLFFIYLFFTNKSQLCFYAEGLRILVEETAVLTYFKPAKRISVEPVRTFLAV